MCALVCYGQWNLFWNGTRLIDCCYFHPVAITSITHKEIVQQLSITAHINSIMALNGSARQQCSVGLILKMNLLHYADHIFCSVLLGNTYDRSIVVDEEEANILLYDIWEQVSQSQARSIRF